MHFLLIIFCIFIGLIMLRILVYCMFIGLNIIHRFFQALGESSKRLQEREACSDTSSLLPDSSHIRGEIPKQSSSNVAPNMCLESSSQTYVASTLEATHTPTLPNVIEVHLSNKAELYVHLDKQAKSVDYDLIFHPVRSCNICGINKAKSRKIIFDFINKA
ncbi:hypothetical protein CQA63_06630 [Helicobacter marmotae]|uniref:Uncharacterized protein n=2 Tax=Helicobacter marmotae TaxID=152490 RepID=A0A3D8I2T7_9HELI|nr:hypothetical protein CQA63_06630 [Helicobacter marmotae]